MGNNANVSKRDGFRSRGGFIIACIGSAVGMGNIWRFPTLVSKWGGMTFLLPYFLFVILIGSTGVIGEFALGRAAGAGPVGAFGMCTEARWGKRRPGELVGYIPVLGSLALAIGYTCVMGWIFKYTFLAFDGGLSAMGQNMDGIVATFNATASAWGANVWVVVAVAVSFVIMSFGIAGGIEKANKIMMPILFLLFVGLGIYVGTLPGASDGYRYIFTIKPAGLLDPYVWIYAFGQAFFSLSVGMGGMAIFGSYIGKEHSLLGESVRIVVLDTFVAITAGLIIFPACFTYHVDQTSGPSLIFITLPNIFANMSMGRLWGSLFFLFMAFAAMSTVLAVFENIICCGMELTGCSRKKSSLVNLVLIILLSMPCVLGYNLWAWDGFAVFGGAVLDVEDFLVSNLFLPLGSLVYLLFCVTRYGWGWDNYKKEVNTGDGLKMHDWMRGYLTYVLPLIVGFIFAFGLYDKFLA